MFHFALDWGAIVAIVFWLFVASVCITPIVVAYKIRKAAMDTIRASIDRGQELSPETIRQLTGIGSVPEDQRLQAVNLKIAGAIVMAGGIGAAIVAAVFLYAVPVAAPFVFAGAALIFCIGAGLHIGAKVLRDHEQEKKTNLAA
ncbi:MAG TPA: hypothetical protein VHL14_08890 [Steroidobacteraceae bacterium]|jgi:hypothetical protein|nr:hypothetical protein [Steroidobacteraceae bacterium]